MKLTVVCLIVAILICAIQARPNDDDKEYVFDLMDYDGRIDDEVYSYDIMDYDGRFGSLSCSLAGVNHGREDAPGRVELELQLDERQWVGIYQICDIPKGVK
ncbi:hypothetical protein EAG_09017 [Camponotus floridanus]|uniref:Uncharacterized protein n=1 Tax=Camponotus floridanus TaxID=104421 RepID=E2AQU4_CAMFO|nr:hypothetical protein EAG_09017 [Camponotus floridanus]